MAQFSSTAFLSNSHGCGCVQPTASYPFAGNVPFWLKRGDLANLDSHRDRLDADPASQPTVDLEANELAVADWVEHLFYSNLANEHVEIPANRHLGAFRPVIIYCHQLTTRL